MSQVPFVAVGKWDFLGTDQHLSECRPQLQCNFLIACKGFYVGVPHIARLSSTGLQSSHTLLGGRVRNESHVFLEALAPQCHTRSSEDEQSLQNVPENNSMFWRVESTLRRSAVGSVVRVELVFELLAFRQRFEEFFKGELGLLLLFRYVRQSVSIPPF